MSSDGTLSTRSTNEARSWQQVLEELRALLAQPLQANTGVTRTGKTVGLRVTPLSGQDQTLLVVRFFPVALGPARGKEDNQADQIAFSTFLDGLSAADLPTRLAACEALGQLGNPGARPALTLAERSENWLIRAAARKALRALAIPRINTTDLSGIPLTLWHQVKQLWKPAETTKTNPRGEALFANISPEELYRLQLSPTQLRAPQPPLILAVRRPTTTEFLPEALAAESTATDVNALPQSQRTALEDGSLVCTVTQNEEEQVVIEFRTDAPQLRDGWVHCRLTHRETRQEILSVLVGLTLKARGILSGRLALGKEVDVTQVYEFDYEPVPAPTWDR